jgi:hypothetical protein
VHVRVRLPGLALWSWALIEWVFEKTCRTRWFSQAARGTARRPSTCLHIKHHRTLQVLLVPRQVTRRGGRRAGVAPKCSPYIRFRISLHRWNPEEDTSHVSSSKTDSSALRA